MALLTEAEKAELKEKGVYVSEKCDHCGQPILEPLSYTKKIDGRKEVWCYDCGSGSKSTGPSLRSIITQEDERMAKVQKTREEKKGTAPSKKIAGVLREGTAIAELYLWLGGKEDGNSYDEKRRKLSEAKKLVARHKVDPMGRIRQLGRYGKTKGWAVLIDEENNTVQLKKGKAPVKAERPAKTAASKKAKKAAPKEEKKAASESAGNTASDLSAVRTLVRRTVKAADGISAAALTKKLYKEFEVDSKDADKAIELELKAGSIKEEDEELTVA